MKHSRYDDERPRYERLVIGVLGAVMLTGVAFAAFLFAAWLDWQATARWP